MSSRVTTQAVSAARWRTIQLAGVNLLFFARLLILARLLAPEAFGVIAVANVAIGIVMRLSNIGIISALTYRGASSDAERDAAWTAGLLRAALVTSVLVMLGPTIVHWFEVPAAADIVQVLVLRTVLDSAISIGIVQLTRELRFRPIALMYLVGALVDLIVAVGLAPALGVWALVCGSLAGGLATLVLSYCIAPHRPRFRLDLSRVAPLARYGRWVLLAGVVTLLGTSLTQMALSRNLGAAALGVFFLATKIAFVPVEALTQVIGSVAFPLFANIQEDRRQVSAVFRALLSAQMMVVLPLYTLLIVLAPALETALGAQWAGLALPLQVLSIAALIATFGDVLTPLLMGTGRPHAVFVTELVQAGVLLAVLLPLLDAFGIAGAALAWLAGNFASFVLCLWLFRKFLPGERAWWPRRMLGAALATMAGAGAAALLVRQLSALPALIVGAAVGSAVVGMCMLLLDRLLGLRLVELFGLLRSGTPDRA